jgi:precorrin-3B synthase
VGAPVEVPPAPAEGPAGIVPQPDGRTALVAVVPLGRLSARQAGLLAAVAPVGLQLTPWRSIALLGLPDATPAAELQAAGLVLDPDSAWLAVTACAGRPGCARALADVRADAATAVATATLPAGGAPQHWAGCERRCGRPRGTVVDVVATTVGYRVGTG